MSLEGWTYGGTGRWFLELLHVLNLHFRSDISLNWLKEGHKSYKIELVVKAVCHDKRVIRQLKWSGKSDEALIRWAKCPRNAKSNFNHQESGWASRACSSLQRASVRLPFSTALRYLYFLRSRQQSWARMRTSSPSLLSVLKWFSFTSLVWSHFYDKILKLLIQSVREKFKRPHRK